MASTVWRGFITFGLISIPVRLFRAARAERVSFRRVYGATPEPAPEPSPQMFDRAGEEPVRLKGKKGEQRAEPLPFVIPAARQVVEAAAPVFAPVQQVSVGRGSEELLPNSAVKKGYEYEKGRFVAIEAEELKSIAPKTATEMQIEEFVRLDEIDPVYFETSYYVVPEEAGEKAYALLYLALQKSGLVALAQFAMHNREHVVVIRSGKRGIVAHTMFFSAEVRGEEEFRADAKSVTEKELQLAETLVQSLAASFEPEKYRDTYREKLQEMIAAKVAGQPVSSAERPSRSAAVVDITEALQKSLAALKKPAASEQGQREPAAKAAGAPAKKASRNKA